MSTSPSPALPPGVQPRGRGRDAARPWQMPLTGWRDAALRVVLERMDDALTASAAGAAFFATLAVFPALLAVVSVYGLFYDATDVVAHVSRLQGLVPAPALDLALQYLGRVAEQQGRSLSLGLALGLAGSLWGANRGTRALMGALNLAYGERERRGLVRRTLVGLALTACGTLAVVGGLVLVAIVPAVIALSGLEGQVSGLASFGRLAILSLGVVGYLLVLLRHGPSRTPARWSWVLPGALGGALAWLLASSLFSAWVSSFGRYDATYGALGTAVVLMLWLYLGTWMVVAAAALNAELERQTTLDTTRGAPLPLGSRGAWAADQVAGRPPPLWRALVKGDRQPVDDEGGPGPAPPDRPGPPAGG